MSNQKLANILDKAKLGTMMEGSVFLSTILFSLKHTWESSVSTADVDGVTMRINPDWFITLTPRARIGLLCHEAWHVALEHMLRVGNRDHKKWNKAADHVINLMLLAAGYELPPNGLHDLQFTGMSTSEIYDLLPDEPTNSQYDCDITIMPEKAPNKDVQALEVVVSNIVLKAIKQSEMANEAPGIIPGEILRKIDKLINPVLPWEGILQRFLNERIKKDYTLTRPNKRFFPDFYLPTQNSEGLENIAIAVDTSGSVTDKQFAAFLAEIRYIHETMKLKKITVIGFDTSIRAVHDIYEGNSIDNIKFTGYGGTLIKPVIDWGIANKPTILLIFTDGYFGTYEPTINFDLMWIIYNNPRFTSNIGEKIQYD